MERRYYQAKPIPDADKCVVSGCDSEPLIGGKMCDYHHRRMPGDTYKSTIQAPTRARLMAGR
jgi:hypothetical protein